MRPTHAPSIIALFLAVILSMPGIAQAQSEPTYDARPGTRISEGPSGTMTIDAASFSFYSTESGSTFECRLDDDAWSACTSPKLYLAVGDGTHTFYVRAIDSAGQRDPTPSSQTWTVDTIPVEEPVFDPTPGTRISSGPTGSATDVTATFGFYSTEPNSTFECRLDNAAWAVCSSPRSYLSMRPGTHTFYVRSVDSAGQRDPTPSSQTWTITGLPGAEPPVEEPGFDPTPGTRISYGPTDTVTDATATFGFYSTEPNSTFECRLDNAAWAVCSSPKAYRSVGPGAHTFYVRSVDSAGQRDPTPSSQTWTVDLAGDPPPGTTISSGPSGTVTATGASFSFDSTELESTFECRLDSTGWAACDSPKNYSALSPGSSHTFYVRSVDSAGQRDPTPAIRSWSIAAPSGTVLLFDGFGIANGLGGVITNEYAGWHAWDTTAPHSPTWRSDGGSLFSVSTTDSSGETGRVAFTGKLDSGFADKYSLTNTHSNKSRYWSRRSGFENVRIDADIKPLAWHPDGPTSWAGFKFHIRRQEAISSSSLYTVEPYIREGKLYIQKKCHGATGGGNYANGGTYYLLASKSGYTTPLDSWQKISAAAKTNADGSVTIGLWRDGTLLLRAVDHGIRSDGTGCAPLLAGHVGFRSDFFQYYLDNYRVTALP